jgi:DNA polymerase
VVSKNASASSGAWDLIPPRSSLTAVRRASRSCHACPLWLNATQTVFGEGPARAPLMMVGEQPGDQEDRAGAPFVGPAGRILDKALEMAGIDRETVYVTNAVKHFKWKPQGKRRIHKRPSAGEMAACRPWLEAEIDRVEPDVVVALGATATQALLGPAARLTLLRGQPQQSDIHPAVVPTAHPSSILRASDEASRKESLDMLVDDLVAAARLLDRRKAAHA